MCEEELLYALALQRTTGIGDITAKKLISHFGSAKNVFRERSTVIQKIDGIGTVIAKKLTKSNALKAAERERDYLLKHKIRFWYYFEKNYPKRLYHCIDSPLLLFGKGNIDLDNPRIISIVGTRNMTSYGRTSCQALVAHLSPYNPLIISGFAYGVDICAHRAAIKNGLQTIAILAHGFEDVYPKVHGKYANSMMDHGGFITEFWHDDEIIQQNFIKRNRIVAGLSEATIIVESGPKGGSLVTADIANSYSRDVFAIPGRVNDGLSIGCNQLISTNKAAILHTPEELVKSLQWDQPEPKSKPIQKTLFVELTPTEQQIADYLEQKGRSVLDSIALHNALKIQETATLLFAMEMKGVIRPLPGKQFERI